MCRGWLVVGVAADSRCWFDQTCQRAWMFLETTDMGYRDDNVRLCKWDQLSSLIPHRLFTYHYSPVQQSFTAQAEPNCLYIHRIQFPAPRQQNPETHKNVFARGRKFHNLPWGSNQAFSSRELVTSDVMVVNLTKPKNFEGSKSTEKHILGQTVLFCDSLL